MNKTKFDQAGGFPLETETLSKMQDAYGIFEAFGDLVGTKSIVKGCIRAGNNISDGVIYWDGELFPFVGGGIRSKIIVVEEVTSVEFEDGQVKPTYYKRHATFGSGIGAVLWSEFKRAYPLTSALYIDKVDMYAGAMANIPAGWHICDGANGTVDLRGRFVVGLDTRKTEYNRTGKTGGLEKVALAERELAQHNHSGSTNTTGNHDHSGSTNTTGSHNHSGSTNTRGSHNHSGTAYGPYSGSNGDGGFDGGNNRWKHRPFNTNNAGNHSHSLNINNNGNHSHSLNINSNGNHSHSLNINNTGNGNAHENRPPFYTLAFIQFKGI